MTIAGPGASPASGIPIRSLRVGPVAPLGARGVPSGIAKTEVGRALALTATG